MKSSAKKIELAGYDSLFGTGGEAEAGGERVQEIPLAELHPFKDHPFHVRNDEEMEKMAESIAEHGVLVPCPGAKPISTQRQNHFPFAPSQRSPPLPAEVHPKGSPLCKLPPQNRVASVDTFAEVNTGKSLCFQGF